MRDERDFIVIWVLGIIALVLLAWFLAPVVVNAAYKSSDYVLEVWK